MKTFYTGFRPQQGLSIMNQSRFFTPKKLWPYSFRPQQGLSIMNMTQKNSTARLLRSFRPQQGLSIMNKHKMFC